MKTPEKIYLDTDDYHEFKYNIEYVNQERKREEDVEYIRIDKAIELMKAAWNSSKTKTANNVRNQYEMNDFKIQDLMTFNDWLEQEKPLDK